MRADYAAPLDRPIRRDWIVRHRLEKVDPTAARSPVKEPIVYYVDRGAPEPIRTALVEGAAWWAQAFEAAGFENAFRVEVMPEGAHPLDVRYNVIQWVHRATRGWSYGGGVVDPRTGEMLKGHVTLGSLRIRQDRLLFEGLNGHRQDGERRRRRLDRPRPRPHPPALGARAGTRSAQEQAEHWLALGNTPEPAFRALMLAYGTPGDMAKVTSLYQRCITELKRQLDLEPSTETRALYEGLIKGSHQARQQIPQPAGTVTFLFTDIEGSTNLLDGLGDQYASVLKTHHEIMRKAILKWNGKEVDTQGDAFFVTFTRALDAIQCVAEAQRDLVAQQWPEGNPVRVRMGLHTGEQVRTLGHRIRHGDDLVIEGGGLHGEDPVGEHGSGVPGGAQRSPGEPSAAANDQRTSSRSSISVTSSANRYSSVRFQV